MAPLPLVQYKNRITKRGELVITSQRYRTQHKNLDDAVLKLDGILREASEVPRGPSELTVARIKALLVSLLESRVTINSTMMSHA